MKNLIGMVDFVIEVNSKEHSLNALMKIRSYANFLKQPLELWMFVPCDEDGNVLEFPTKENSLNTIDHENRMMEYQQAKDACIFKNNLLSLIEIKELISKNKTIEFLINHHYEKTGSYLEANKELF